MTRLGADPDAWEWGIPYRIGYGAGRERRDAATFTSTYHGRARGKPLDAAAIVEEVVLGYGRELGDEAIAAIREGVEDASEGRWPKW